MYLFRHFCATLRHLFGARTVSVVCDRVADVESPTGGLFESHEERDGLGPYRGCHLQHAAVIARASVSGSGGLCTATDPAHPLGLGPAETPPACRVGAEFAAETNDGRDNYKTQVSG